jgi:hypothetical protein
MIVAWVYKVLAANFTCRYHFYIIKNISSGLPGLARRDVVLDRLG